MIKNGGPILCPDVGALPIQSRRIVVRPKNIEQLVITNLRRIEFNFDHLSMTGLICADILVGRIVFVPARLTDGCRNYALQFAKSFLYAPKTSCPECRFLCDHAA